MSSSGERNQGIDILKGIGIFLMVFDHVGWGSFVHTYIQSFHMPLFFIVSGYLWKRGKPVSLVARLKAKSVLIPYVSFAAIYLALHIILSRIELSDLSLSQAVTAVLFFPTDMAHIPFAPALWFLPCFYFSNVTFAALDKYFGHKKWMPILIISILGMFFSTISDKMLPFCLEPFAVALLFMYLGMCIKQHEEVILWLSKWWVIIAVIIVEMVLSYINGSCDMRSARYNNCFLYISNAVLGTLGWWSATRKCMQSISPIFLKILKYLSINAISFICMNQVIIMVLTVGLETIWSKKSIMAHIGINLIVFVFTLMICMGLNEIINRTKLKRIIGK